MAFTINRRLSQLLDSSGQLLSGKIPNDYITTDHIANNAITTSMLHTGFLVPSSSLSSIDTDNVEEGSTNVYYTDARVGTYISGNRSYGNITTTGYLAGPATFTIDPAGVGDNTGTVVIAGNLQVDGTTTTINSTTLAVDDLNLTLASGAADSSAANGAGITIDGASATITYDGTNDEWDFNKGIHINSTDSIKLPVGTTAQRNSSPVAGMFRYNSTTGEFEGYTDAWGAIAGGGNGSYSTDKFTATSGQTNFTLSSTVTDEDNLIVFVDGVFQAHDTYTVSGTTLIFSTGIVLNRVVTVYHVTPVSIGVPSDNTVTSAKLSGALTTPGDLTVPGSGDVNTGILATHSRAGVGMTLRLNNTNNGSDKGSGIKWQSGGFDTSAIIGRSDAAATSGDSPGYLTLHTSADGTDNLTERMRIDSSGNVGIGTTPQSTVGIVDIAGSATNYNTAPMITFRDSTGAADSRNWSIGNIAINYGDFHIGVGNSNSDYFDATSHSKFMINKDGNVGIGTTSPATGLEVATTNYTFAGTNFDIYGLFGDTSGGIRLGADSSNEDSVIGTTGTNNLQFVTYNGSAWGSRMTLTNTGNLLVGNTVVNPASGFASQKGFGYAASTGKVEIATDANAAVMELGKNNSNDGSILVFRKQSNTVGSIGTEGGDIVIGTGDTAVQFADSLDCIRPFTSSGSGNGGRDNAIDLGASGQRFKDLHLSNRANVGHVHLSNAGNYTNNHVGVYANGTVVNTAASQDGWLMQGGYGKLKWDSTGVMLNGITYEPNKPHWYGSVTNTNGSGVANSGVAYTALSNNTITGSVVSGQFRLIAPHGGLYLINFNTICDTTTGRIDSRVLVNGNVVTEQLSENNGTGYHYRGVSIVVKLAYNDYVTFVNDDWYNATVTTFEAWRTASITMIG